MRLNPYLAAIPAALLGGSSPEGSEGVPVEPQAQEMGTMTPDFRSPAVLTGESRVGETDPCPDAHTRGKLEETCQVFRALVVAANTQAVEGEACVRKVDRERVAQLLGAIPSHKAYFDAAKVPSHFFVGPARCAPLEGPFEAGSFCEIPVTKYPESQTEWLPITRDGSVFTSCTPFEKLVEEAANSASTAQ